MPLQNRVTPQGIVERNGARGTLMGNRGVMHDSNKELRRQFKTKAWITCQLEFKGRKRELMTPKAYTELFFLDEVTAFAAGHRPCAECRRARYNEFRNDWMTANEWDGSSAVRAPELDGILHKERLQDDQKVTWKSPMAELPHGAMFVSEGDSYAVSNGKILKWCFSGYGPADSEKLPETVDVLTPRSVVNVFTSGFRPEFHSTAGA